MRPVAFLLAAAMAAAGCCVARAEGATLAIVAQDRTPLRASARRAAPTQTLLWQGDALEVRGRNADYLKVYDHRRERPGYVRASQVHVLDLEPGHADEYLAIVRFLRDTPGSEALGIAYVGAYLKAAPAKAIGAEAFDALGTMAERLAHFASVNTRKSRAETIAAHLDVAASYGVTIASFERDGRVQLCYDGEAFRRVLALASSDEQKARAALGLTRPECVDPALTPLDRANLDAWRADLLDRVPRLGLPEYVRDRVRIRSATVWASIAFERARRGEPAREAADRALSELAGVDRRKIAEGDAFAYDEAAVRVGAVRWAAEPEREANTKKLSVVTEPGEPGQTCVRLIDGRHDRTKALAERCTWGIVWSASARANPNGRALALAVQPLDGWRELWIFRHDGSGWHVDALPPATEIALPGYVEFAGWVPGGRKLLAAREVRIAGRFVKRFEVLDLASLAVERHADAPTSLSTFYRWQDASWKSGTVALR